MLLVCLTKLTSILNQGNHHSHKDKQRPESMEPSPTRPLPSGTIPSGQLPRVMTSKFISTSLL